MFSGLLKIAEPSVFIEVRLYNLKERKTRIFHSLYSIYTVYNAMFDVGIFSPKLLHCRFIQIEVLKLSFNHHHYPCFNC